MEILYLIIAIIIVIFRKYKDTMFKAIKKFALRVAVLTLSLLLVVSLVVSELAQRLLDRIGKVEQRMKYQEKAAKAGGAICFLEKRTRT